MKGLITVTSGHPQMADALYGLALLAQARDNDREADALYQQAWQIWQETLGPENPEAAQALSGLASLAWKEGKDTRVEILYQRVLAIRERHRGADHPSTAETLYDLALLRQKQGRLSEACFFIERALSIRTQSLGDAHPKTGATRLLHAQLVREQAAETEPTLEHLRILLKARGWSMHLKKQRGKPHVYATRKAGQYTRSRYLVPLSNLAACLAAASTLPNANEE